MKRNRTGIAFAIVAAFSRAFTMRAAAAEANPALAALMAPKGRSRTPGPRRSAGAKLERGAQQGTLTKRHPSAVDSYFAEITAKRAAVTRMRKRDVALRHFHTGSRHAQS